MEIKLERERTNLICHGCLITDRELRHIRGEYLKIFHFLRNDEKTDVLSRELLLCWECVGFLKKFKMFCARIRKAESLLVAYLQNCDENVQTTPKHLSTLKNTQTYTHTYNSYEEEKLSHELANNDNIELKYEEEEQELEVESTLDIKIEYNDNIKEESNFSNDNDANNKIYNYSNENECNEYNDSDKDDTGRIFTKGQKKTVKRNCKKAVTKSSNDSDPDYNHTEFKIAKNGCTRVKKKPAKRKCEKMAVTENINDNDFNFNYTELRIEKEDNIDKPSIIKKKTVKRKCEKMAVTESNNVNDSDSNDKINKNDNDSTSKDKTNRNKPSGIRHRYKMLATVSKRMDVDKKRYYQYAEPVCLNQKDYEDVLLYDITYRTRGKHTTFKCNQCQLKYIFKLDLLRHMSFRHNQKATFPYKCAACDTMITSSEHLEEHWTERHTKMLKCTLCSSKVYRTMADIKDHVYKKHTKNYTCKECGMVFGMLSEFKKHYKDMHAKVVCDYCNKIFSLKKFLLRHIRNLHIPAYCKLCDRHFMHRYSFNYHNTVTHPELTVGEAPKELSYCVECDKQFPSVLKYQKHLSDSVRHTPKQKIRVPCPECGKVFSKKTFMNNHFNLFHLKVTKHHCKQCDKYFANGYGLRLHIKRIHEKVVQPKDKFCDICGRGFSSNKILQNHRRTHTGERPYKCSYCPAAFAQKGAMNTHQKTQHKSELNVSGQV